MSKKKKTSKLIIDSKFMLESSLHQFQLLLSSSEFDQLKVELNTPLTPTIRINTLKHDPLPFEASLQKIYGWDISPIPFCPAGCRVEINQNSLNAAIEHRMGSYYIQDAASMLPAELFDFSGLDQPVILDLAASPGGKTTHLVDRSGDKGLVIANDSSRARLKALQIILQKWGALNQAITCYPGERFGDWFPSCFDLVLLDAPCSMQGLRSSESHPVRSISANEQQRLVQRQLSLLESALRSTRVGGQIVYSTCTLAPEEDEAVIAALLARYPQMFKVENVRQKLSLPAPGLTSYHSVAYPQEIGNTLRLWPHLLHTAGFFAARLTKLADLQGAAEPYPQYDIHQAGFEPCSQKNRQEVANQIQIMYGFDIDKKMQALNVSLWKRDLDLYLMPESLFSRFPFLHMTSTGMLIGKMVEKEFIPSHEFVARFGHEFLSGRVILEDKFLSAWLRGEDIRGYIVDQQPSARIVVVMDQMKRNLGRGKILSNQLKNLLPNRIF